MTGEDQGLLLAHMTPYPIFCCTSSCTNPSSTPIRACSTTPNCHLESHEHQEFSEGYRRHSTRNPRCGGLPGWYFDHGINHSIAPHCTRGGVTPSGECRPLSQERNATSWHHQCHTWLQDWGRRISPIPKQVEAIKNPPVLPTCVMELKA